MTKKGILFLYGMEVGMGRLWGWMWGVVLLISLLINSQYARAEMCTEIDYNKPTIAAGWGSTLAIKQDGTVVATGTNWYEMLNVSDWSDIKAVAAGAYHTVGLKEDGTVVAKGWIYSLDGVAGWNIKAIATDNYYTTLGLKEDGTVVSTRYDVSDWHDIKAIAAGWSHVVGFKEDGTVVAKGWGAYGQLNVSSWTNIKAIAAGEYHTVGLKEDGTVVAVGGGWDGQLNVSGWTNIKAIAAGDRHTVGLKEDGTVVAAGPDRLISNLSSWTDITAIAAGMLHTVGLKKDGTVVAVGGHNWNGELNVSSWSNIRQPSCLNKPPVANAGSDQTIECAGPSGSSVILNGSASSDLDGDPLIYIWTWDGGSAEGVRPTVMLPLGTTVVTLTVNDGKVTATDTVNITVQDTAAPVATATGGSENWYNANVISTFSATDSCSGVKEIRYNINGAETVIPGDSASLTLTADGIYSVTYYSVDNAGNAESPKSMTVRIDKTAPVLNLSSNPNILWPPNRKMIDVLIGGNATDAISGIASVVFTVMDEYGIVQPSISNFNTTIQLEAWREGTDKDGRHYTINAVATDTAGNKTTTSTLVLVPHDQGN